MEHRDLPIAIIGAGPVGLAAAAELVTRGERVSVLEAGGRPGHSIRDWAHVSMLSPWEFNTSKVAVRLLEASGWRHPPARAIPPSCFPAAR